MKKFKKINVLLWGIKHIAENHHFNYNVDYEEDGAICIYGGCNVPTFNDVRMLCEDLGMPIDCIETSEFGIDVYLEWDWLQEKDDDGDPSERWGLLMEDYTPTNYEMWKRHNVAIGE